jgi:hypothetical protein
LNRIVAGEKLYFTADLFLGSSKVAHTSQHTQQSNIEIRWLTDEAAKKVTKTLSKTTQLVKWIESEIESYRIVHAIQTRTRKTVLSVYHGEIYSFKIPPDKLDETNDVGLSVRDRLVKNNAGHTLLNGLTKNELTDVLRNHHVLAPKIAI